MGGKFFNLLMDRVLNTLQEKGLGCHIDTIIAGAAYIDNLILLLPSLIDKQFMLNLSSNEFNSMGLRFNVFKCVALVTGKTKGSVLKNLVLYDDAIHWLKEMCYLGLHFKAGNKLSIDISNRCGKFIGSIASVLRGQN